MSSRRNTTDTRIMMLQRNLETDFEGIAKLSDEYLLTFPNVGKKTLRRIRERMSETDNGF